MQRYLPVLLACTLAALTVVTFWPACDNGFVNLDDEDYVVRNPHVLGGLTAPDVVWAFRTFHASNWHPLTWLSLQFNAGLWTGSDSRPVARGFHLTNVLLHAANVVLLFLVLRSLTARLWPSVLVAAIFAVHPLRAESVAWVSERKDVLSVFFGLLALWAYAEYAHARSLRRYLSLAACFALSLLAKPMLVTLPFLLLVLDWWPLGRLRPVGTGKAGIWSQARPLVLEKLPLFALAAGSCVATWLAQHATAVSSLDRVPLDARTGNAVVAYAVYLGQTFWPVGLAPFYPIRNGPSPAVVAACTAFLVVVSLTAASQWQSRPYLLAGWLWYVGTLVPVIGLVQVGAQAHADRYTYWPLVGIYLMIVWGFDELAGRLRARSAGFAVAGVAVVVLAVLCQRQVRLWHDDLTLWRHALRVTGDNWLALYSLGLAEERADHVGEAIGYYQKAIVLYPQNASLHARLGVAYHRLGLLPEARGSYKAALRINPEYGQVHANLGAALRGLGDAGGALEHLRRAVELEPDNPENAAAYYNLGQVLEGFGRPGEAIDAYRHAVRLEPSSRRYREALGSLLRRTGG